MEHTSVFAMAPCKQLLPFSSPCWSSTPWRRQWTSYRIFILYIIRYSLSHGWMQGNGFWILCFSMLACWKIINFKDIDLVLCTPMSPSPPRTSNPERPRSWNWGAPHHHQFRTPYWWTGLETHVGPIPFDHLAWPKGYLKSRWLYIQEPYIQVRFHHLKNM